MTLIYGNSIPKALTVTVKLRMLLYVDYLKLPKTAHTWLLGPLIRQQDIRLQLMPVIH